VKRWWFGVMIVGLVSTAGLITSLALRGRAEDDLYSDITEADRQVIYQEIVLREVNAFKQSQRIPLAAGETFPELELPIIRGTAYSEGAPAVFLIGSAISPTIRETLNDLQDTAVQKIYIVTSGEATRDTADIGPEVTLLDATNSDPLHRFSTVVNVAVGVHRLSMYLTDANRQIVFAAVNGSHLVRAFSTVVQDYVATGTFAEQAPDGHLLYGDELPLEGLPHDVAEAIQQELNKPVTVIIASHPSCDMCKNLLDKGHAFIPRWQEQGVGLLLLEGSEKPTPVTEHLADGIVKVADPPSLYDGLGTIMDRWSVFSVPNYLVFREGRYLGVVEHWEAEIYGRYYDDIGFGSVDTVLTTLLD
jgi:hypothetical protein